MVRIGSPTSPRIWKPAGSASHRGVSSAARSHRSLVARSSSEWRLALKLDADKPHADNPGFSGQAWARNADLYETIRTMPFNTELAAGVLSEARFRHYITQDAHYLVGFGRALALAAAKAPNPDP